VADGSRLMPDRVEYGRVPPGFVVRIGPEPLQQGCYKALLSGAAPTVFDVTSAGAISVRAP